MNAGCQTMHISAPPGDGLIVSLVPEERPVAGIPVDLNLRIEAEKSRFPVPEPLPASAVTVTLISESGSEMRKLDNRDFIELEKTPGTLVNARIPVTLRYGGINSILIDFTYMDKPRHRLIHLFSDGPGDSERD